jgi:hypothetical protein
MWPEEELEDLMCDVPRVIITVILSVSTNCSYV